MKGLKFLVLLWGIIILGLTYKPLTAQEQDLIPTPLTKKVGDYYVSIGVFSIEELKKVFPRAYKLLVRHHGEPSKRDTHHLAVSIWKGKGNEIVYLSGYEVEAEIRSPIFRASRKRLSLYPHQHGDNYGNWFEMSDKGLYHIAVIIKEGKEEKRVTFDYLVQ